MPSPSSPTQRFRIGTFDFQLRGLSIISEADVYGFFMRPHFTEAHGNVAPNLEAYEVVSQLIFGQSKIAFTENFLPPNLGYYGVAYHTSEAPGLPTLQGRLPSPQDGRVAIRLLPLAGLLLRRADMLDKGVYIMDTLPLCGPPCGHAALAAPKPFSTGFLSSASSSALCVWPSHPHGAFFCRTFPVSAVTSLQVAEIFGKRHYDVMQDISRILSRLSASFMVRNFSRYETEYKVGFGMKKISAYLLSKDGFPYAKETSLPAHPALCEFFRSALSPPACLHPPPVLHMERAQVSLLTICPVRVHIRRT